MATKRRGHQNGDSDEANRLIDRTEEGESCFFFSIH